MLQLKFYSFEDHLNIFDGGGGGGHYVIGNIDVDVDKNSIWMTPYFSSKFRWNLIIEPIFVNVKIFQNISSLRVDYFIISSSIYLPVM